MRIYCTPIGICHVIDDLQSEFPQVQFIQQGGIASKVETEKALLTETHAIIGSEIIDAEFLKRTSLTAIARFGGSVENIDLSVADKLNIDIFSYKSSQVVSDVANITLSFVLNASIGMNSYHSNIKRGSWHRPSYLGAASSVVILGSGKVGGAVYERLLQLEYRNVKQISMREILSSSDKLNALYDCISTADILILNGNPNYWPKEEFMQCLRALKNTCVLINTARGQLLDEEKLYTLLQQKIIAEYYTDVLTHEPPTGISSRLLELDNVTATPHVGGYSRLGLLEVARSCVKFLIGK